MLRFVSQRLLHLLPVIIGVTFVSFLIIHFTPGDFLTKMSLNPSISPDRISRLREDFGLDHPWYVQYALWLYRLSPVEFPFGLKWPDLGYSFAYRAPVKSLLGDRFFNTLVLSVSAEMIAWLIAVPLGIVAGVRRQQWIDRVVSSAVFLGISFPQILLALLALLFAAKTGWFPIGGMRSLSYNELSAGQKFLDVLHHLALPAFVLAVAETASLMRYMRGSLIETLRSEYVRTARAKGLSESKVVLRHAVPNAINPLITLLGISFGNLISASFLVEIIMGWPGLGRLAYEAILAKDLYLIMASLLMSTLFLVIGNLISDLLLALSDPRVRYE